MRFAYADPPYLGMGKSMYGYPEWDDKGRHYELLSALREDFPDGWALSCNPRDLVWLLPACESRWPDVRVCAWVKPYHQIRPTSVQYAWEPVLLHGGRSVPSRNPMVRDWYSAGATRQRAVRGAKPAGFCRWVLDLLGFDADEDTLVDLFPGSGIMDATAAQGVLA
jgi:hypothetical protein